MKLDKLIEVLPYKRISQDRAVRLLFEAGVPVTAHDSTVATGVLTAMATFGLIRRAGGPYKPDVERVRDPLIAQPREQKVPTAQFHPIDVGFDPALARALRREISQ